MCLGGSAPSTPEPVMQPKKQWDYSTHQTQKVDKVNEDWTTESTPKETNKESLKTPQSAKNPGLY